MDKKHIYNPIKYFGITLLITWISLFAGAYCSHTPRLEGYQILCMLPGLFSPFIVAAYMIFTSKDKELKKSFKERAFNLKLIKAKYLPAIFLIMPFALFSATVISLLFGQSINQFSLSSEFAIIGGEAILSVFILFLAPTMEELGWRGYGMDSLRRRGNLLKSTMIFALLWNLWHVPLFFIKDYYQYEILHTNVIFALNFVISIIPSSILMSWIFYKNNRSIVAVILFHFLLNLFSVLFQTEQITKCIITIVLLIISGVVVLTNKKMFLENSYEE